MKIKPVVSAHKTLSEKLDKLDWFFTHWHIYVLLVFWDKRVDIFEVSKIAYEFVHPQVEFVISNIHLPVFAFVHIIWFMF